MLRKFRSFNPFNGQLIKQFDYLSERELIEKIEDSKEGCEYNRRRSFVEKRRICEKMQEIIKREEENYAELICVETGKRLEECRQEVKEGGEWVGAIGKQVEKLLGQERIKVQGVKKSHVSKGALGTILQVGNYQQPFLHTLSVALPILMGGNAVLLRPPDNCPLTSLAFQELCIHSGYGLNELQVVFSHQNHSALMLSHPQVQGLHFTGSREVGVELGGMAVQHNKRQRLCVGGSSNTWVILQDAHLDKAVHQLVSSGLQANGQHCLRPSKILVHPSLTQLLLNKLTLALQQIQYDNPLHSHTQLGPLSRQDIADKLQIQIATAIQQGAEILIGGLKKKGCEWDASVMVANEECEILEQEVVGPLWVVVETKEDRMLEVGKKGGMQQSAGVFSRDEDKALVLLNQLHAHSLHLNHIPTTHSHHHINHNLFAYQHHQYIHIN